MPVVGPMYSAALFAEIVGSRLRSRRLSLPSSGTAPSQSHTNAPIQPGAARLSTRCRDLSDHVPVGVQLGYHLCYGDFEHKHGLQPPSLAVCVEIANGIAAQASRPVDWVHMPVPRDRDDAGYVAPLDDLRLSGETRLYLGLVHYTDGVDGNAQTHRHGRVGLPRFRYCH